MSKVIILKGLPASGKSTWAKAEVERTKKNTVRVNKDDLRAMMGGYRHDNEEIVIELRNKLIKKALLQKRHVIVDDTNFNPIHLQEIENIVKELGGTVEIKEFHTDVEECIKRDALRQNPVGPKVIREMSEQYNWGIAKPEFSQIIQNVSLTKAVIIDIDGTLAKMNGRSPYDYSKVAEDTLHEDISQIAKMFADYGNAILLCSGRPESCREDTEFWLAKHQIHFDQLNMRETGDNRSDTIVKREMLEKIVEKFYVRYVFDDRRRVVKMWRESGLRCLQVADGDF